MSGDSFLVMIDFTTSGKTSVFSGGSDSSVSHPSSNRYLRCFSNRPDAFDRAPRPRSCEGGRAGAFSSPKWGLLSIKVAIPNASLEERTNQEHYFLPIRPRKQNPAAG